MHTSLVSLQSNVGPYCVPSLVPAKLHPSSAWYPHELLSQPGRRVRRTLLAEKPILMCLILQHKHEDPSLVSLDQTHPFCPR